MGPRPPRSGRPRCFRRLSRVEARIRTLGPARFPSPLSSPVSDGVRVPETILRVDGDIEPCTTWEVAGPRERLFFAPGALRAAVVTCGGLCPGLNNVLRSLFLHLHHLYGLKELLGVRYGYAGLDPDSQHPPVPLARASVGAIHRLGGTVLGTSRGPVPLDRMLATLRRLEVGALFCVGGDGTMRGAHALSEGARAAGYPLAVVGIPKTIDNDIQHVTRSFGFRTAVEVAREVLDAAHNEATSVRNGVSIVKLMGREAGFLAAEAALASQDANFVLVPEVPFALEGPRGFLAALDERLAVGGHALIVVAEGAGQELVGHAGPAQDASGNRVLGDIGVFLKERIHAHLKSRGIPFALRYLDPSYSIRSRPANCEDSILCDQLARRAADAALAGKTDLVVASVHDVFVHLPLEVVTGRKRVLDPEDEPWRSVLASTGQPRAFV
ncbi:MAG: ATP-dependent 6-phosphofructokinase [Planctomycetes bacterium]|nr:ATP-dependent 6-phosphofructokinase [Planctomycetota bacterium]